MLELIREHESLFAKVPPTTSARSPRGLHHSPSALRPPHLRPPPCLRQLSMPRIVERSREPGQNHRYNNGAAGTLTASRGLKGRPGEVSSATVQAPFKIKHDRKNEKLVKWSQSFKLRIPSQFPCLFKIKGISEGLLRILR